MNETTTILPTEEDMCSILRTLLQEVNPAIPDDLQNTANLFNNGWMDSFAIVSLVIGIEEAFEIALEENDLTEENLETVSRIVALIKRSA